MRRPHRHRPLVSRTRRSAPDRTEDAGRPANPVLPESSSRSENRSNRSAPIPLGRTPEPVPTRRTTPGWRIVAALAISVSLGLATTACGSDDTATSEPPTSTTAVSTPAATDPPATASPTTTTTAPSGDDAEVRATIDRYWDAFLAATSAPGDDHEELSTILDDQAHIRILGSIESMAQKGQRVITPKNSAFSREVTAVTFEAPDRATVTECVIDDLQIVEGPNEAVVNDTVTTSNYTTTLHKADATWRITTREQTYRREGVVSCAELPA